MKEEEIMKLKLTNGNTVEQFLQSQPDEWRQGLIDAILYQLNHNQELDRQEIFVTCRALNREKQRKAGLI